MDGQRELATWLSRWPQASRQVEIAPGDACLTAEEIVRFVDDQMAEETRERAATHLSRCSYCTREVGSLFRAAQEFDDRMMLRRVLGHLADRASACLRVFVEEARGAFLRADALLPGASSSARLQPVWAPAGLDLSSARCGAFEDDTETDEDDDAIHEAALLSEGLPSVELLCGEEDGGSITISLAAPCELRLITPDGSARALEVELGEDRYYANVTGMRPGSYLLAFMRVN